MTRRSRIWLVVAVLFFVVNLSGAGMAAAQGEGPHAGLHVGLALLAACLAWWLVARRAAPAVWPEAEAPAVPSALTSRLTHLEQSVDAVAIEVERIGEGQRYMTRLFTEHGPPPASDDRARKPMDHSTQEAVPPPAPRPD